jgi:hypothetical protein
MTHDELVFARDAALADYNKKITESSRFTLKDAAIERAWVVYVDAVKAVKQFQP